MKAISAKLAKIEKQHNQRVAPKKRRKTTIAWTIIKYVLLAAVLSFLAYSAYIVYYKYGRCQDNKEANKLSY